MTSIQSGRDITSCPVITSDCSFRKKERAERGRRVGEEGKRKRRKERGWEREDTVPLVIKSYWKFKEGGTQGQKVGRRKKLYLFILNNV